MLLVYNFEDEATGLTLPDFPLETGHVYDLLGEDFFGEGENGNVYTLEIGPRAAYWLVPR